MKKLYQRVYAFNISLPEPKYVHGWGMEGFEQLSVVPHVTSSEYKIAILGADCVVGSADGIIKQLIF